MACLHPLYMVDSQLKSENGKPVYKFVRSQEVNDVNRHQFLAVPCGQCIECRLQYARNWANRCMLEAQDYDHNWFVTLTYENPPVSETGCYTLDKRDIQLFFKQLRNLSGQKFRYFGCGEYGEKTFRPHYHYIVFGLDLSDLVPWRRNGLKNVLYRSKLLEEAWPHGHVEIGSCTWDSCCYVSRYVTKKLKGDDAKLYKDLGVIPPFVTMSRRPGIGARYFELHGRNMYAFDKIVLGTEDGKIEFRPPRYFDEKLKQLDPDLYQKVKDEREVKGFLSQLAEESGTDLGFKAYSDVKEKNLEARVSSLERSLE